jgi:hypothetical protein
LHTSNEEDILLRALTVINEKKRRLRLVKDQLADVQNDFKLFKERTAAAAAAQAGSPVKKRPKTSGCSANSEPSKETGVSKGGKTNASHTAPPSGRTASAVDGAATAAIVGRDANATGEQRASVVGSAAIASSSVPIFSHLSQNSVSTQELTKNFPWANLGF